MHTTGSSGGEEQFQMQRVSLQPAGPGGGQGWDASIPSFDGESEASLWGPGSKSPSLLCPQAYPDVKN